MVEDQGSGGWGKKAFFVVIGLAVPLVLWLLNRKEEATEAPAGTSSARTPSSPPAQDSSPVATSPLQSPPAATAPLTSSAPVQTPEPSDPIVTVPFSSAAAPGSEAPVVPATAPEAREATPVSAVTPKTPETVVSPEPASQPARPAETQEGTEHTLTDFVKTHPEEVVAAASSSAPPVETVSDAPVFASPAATESADVEGNTGTPPVAEFAKGFPCDVEISDSDGKLHAAHLLSLDLKAARVRCERPLQASEKLRLTIKTKSGDTITPTGAITSVDGDEITLKLLKLNEGLRKRLQAFLDEQQQA